jgi:4-hydroxybenzoate polyprenyltransferase
MAMDDGSLGGRTWLKMFGILLAVGIAVILVLVFISNSIAKWGFFGGFLVIGAVLLLLAWLYDKREAKKNAEWGLPE